MRSKNLTKLPIVFYAAHLPPHSHTAAAVRCDLLIREMQNSGLPVEVWTSSHLPSNKESFLFRLTKEVKAGMILSLRVWGLRLRGPVPRFFVLSSPPYIVCLMASWACRLSRIPYVLDVRDLYPEAYFHAGLIGEKSLHGRFQKFLARTFYSGAKHIFAATQGLKEHIEGQLGRAQEVTLVRNGFDSNVFSALGTPPGEFTCVFHGNLGHMQNIDLLMDVASRVYVKKPSIRFLVMGQGVQEHLLKTKAPPNLQFIGEISYSEIPKRLSMAHLGISFREDGLMGQTAFPVKVYEYIGSGLPSIVTPRGEAGQILENEGMGFQFDNVETGRIVDCILRLSDKGTEYEQLRQRVCELRDSYSRQRSAQLFVANLMTR